MKITKYNEACLLIETNGKRILVDPGNIDYTEDMYEKEWKNIDYILVTHKHNDHCLAIIINKIVARDNAKLYTTYEVLESQPLYGVNVIKAGDIIDDKAIKIYVTKAVHGFLPAMKNNEIKENVGYIIDDGKKRLYITSDTIGFNNDYKCDVLCMPFNGNGLTLGISDGVLFAKETEAKLVLPIHMQHPNPIMNPNKNILKKTLEENNIEYKILDIGESIEV